MIFSSKIFIKAEANEQIGKGHLQRCTSLANELKIIGVNIEFFFSNTSKHLIENVNKNYNVHIIHKKKQYDFKEYSKFIKRNDLIIFDTDDFKFYSGNLIEQFKRNKIQTACFTITDAHKISTDILINTNIISYSHTYKTTTNTLKLLGPNYLIFNKTFRANINFDKVNTNEKRLLLFFGNADNLRLTEYFIKTVKLIEKEFAKIHIIIGELNKRKNEIIYEANNLPRNKTEISIGIKPEEIIKIYRNTNISINSAGMSMWEMALFGITQLVVPSSIRENSYTDYLKEKRYIHKITDFKNLPSIEACSLKIMNIIENKIIPIKLNEFKNIINPNGIKNIAITLKEYLNT